MKLLRTLYTVSILVPLTVLFTALALLLWPFDLLERNERLAKGQIGRWAIWIKKNWFRLIFWSHRIRVEVLGPGAPSMKMARSTIFISNHSSVLDIPAISLNISEHSSFLAKREIKWVPLFGWSAIMVGSLFVDRSKGSRNPSLDKINQLIKRGISVILFPEGTRSATGAVLPFKRGAAVMAIESQTNIIPLTISGSRDLAPKGSFNLRSGTIRIYADLPISTVGMTLDQRGELSERLKSLIANRLASMPQ